MLLLEAKTDSPRWLSRFSNKKWMLGAVIFVVGVPCAILLGFSRQFGLIFRDREAVGCHVSLKYGLASPVIGRCSTLLFASALG